MLLSTTRLTQDAVLVHDEQEDFYEHYVTFPPGIDVTTLKGELKDLGMVLLNEHPDDFSVTDEGRILLHCSPAEEREW